LKEITNQICHTLSGKVISGRKIGRKIGFPTANLELLQNSFYLNRGVYGVKVFYDGLEYFGIMNVGRRPTFQTGNMPLHYEVHIFDFNQDIYEKTLNITVCFYLREEISFPTVDQLVKQINQDKEMALEKFLLAKQKMS
jgi:riboflavin kinase